MRLTLILLTVLLTACLGDESLRAYGAADKVWRVTELRDTPFTASATLTFPEPGLITGMAPCLSLIHI